jgi:hypothetical protein
MIKIISLFILVSVFSVNSFCQKDSGLIIQYLKIEDTAMTRLLTDFIIHKNATDSAFKKGVGYIQVYGSNYQKRNPKTEFSDTVFQFSIDIQDIPCFKVSSDGSYPMYYTFIAGKLVQFFMFEGVTKITPLHFSEKSKADFRKVQAPFLNSAEEHYIEGNSESISLNKFFRPKHEIMMIYVLRNGYKKIVVWEKSRQ